MKRTLALLLCLAGLASAAFAQQPATTTIVPPATTTTVITNSDSSETREQLREILRGLPPEVGKALKLDPMLWSNKEYLSTYPTLAVFIGSHPEVAHNPAFFLESVWIPTDAPAESSGFRIWRDVMESVSIVVIMLIVIGALTWLIRTVIEHRRWNRVSSVQAEVHNKLLDRFASNEELLKYIETSAGRRFLESAPLSIDANPRAIAAPFTRVLWSMQAGLVLTATGIGMEYVSGSIDKDVSQPLSVLGVLGISIGVGLLIAAVAAYILSRKMGLLRTPADAEPAATE
jgi:hypothetical protein